MDKFCSICFRDTEKELHQEWCPNKPQEIGDMFGGVFKDIFNNKNENREKGDSAIND